VLPDRILEVHTPSSKAAEDALNDGNIITKRISDYSYKVVLKERMMADSLLKENVKDYLYNLNEEVKMTNSLIRNLSSKYSYFLGGYFMYASMFAAVGSLVNEDMQDAQQMTIPISMPIIFAFIIMAATAENPNSPLAIFGSLFPLTSPIVMMARIPYDVPGWQLGLSMLFLVIGFIGMTWISGKIYRTGILMYGKKITWKEVFKWLRYH
jgi:ABC-type Na+ efflux pump permease subunit